MPRPFDPIFAGIIDAVALKATSAASESIKARRQPVKRMAGRLRSRERFHNAIDFHLGGLQLDPLTRTRF